MFEMRTEVDFGWMIKRLDAAGIVLDSMGDKPPEVEAALRLLRIIRSAARLAQEMQANDNAIDVVEVLP